MSLTPLHFESETRLYCLALLVDAVVLFGYLVAYWGIDVD